MKKKIFLIIVFVIAVPILIYNLYNTFAIDTVSTGNLAYTVSLSNSSTVTISSGSTKVVYYQITNDNKGKVKYLAGYTGGSDNLYVYEYNDSIDEVEGYIDYGENKFIKLRIVNYGTSEENITLGTVLGYEFGGNFILPNNFKLINIVYPSLAYNMTNSYMSSVKTNVVSNNITYKYDTSNKLMMDDGKNIRYYGDTPNNYIYFNCNDYTNQDKNTCEVWRIIGVFDGKVKLLRNSNIGLYSRDNKNISTGALTNTGDNDWTTARLMKMLNPVDYYIGGIADPIDQGIGQSLYYNRASGTCYNLANNATIDCDFSSTGIRENTRNLIAEATYYLGGYNVKEVYVNQMYNAERNNSAYGNWPTRWVGKVALPYASDYGYAVDLSQCKDKNLNAYNDEICMNYNWMKSIMVQNNYTFLLNPKTDHSTKYWVVNNLGAVYFGDSGSDVRRYVTPVLHINANIDVSDDNTGSSNDPYKIIINNNM